MTAPSGDGERCGFAMGRGSTHGYCGVPLHFHKGFDHPYTPAAKAVSLSRPADTLLPLWCLPAVVG